MTGNKRKQKNYYLDDRSIKKIFISVFMQAVKDAGCSEDELIREDAREWIDQDWLDISDTLNLPISHSRIAHLIKNDFRVSKRGKKPVCNLPGSLL